MNRRPPATAAWLLRTFGTASTADDLLGDLSEEYAAGRSAWWFWWQVLAAIVIGVMNEVRAHPALTLRAIAVGWLAMFLLTVGLSFVQEVIEVRMWFYFFGPIAWFVRGVLSGYLAGWLVGRAHSRHRVSAVLAFVGWLAAQTIYAYSITPPRPVDMDVIEIWTSSAWVRWAFSLAPMVAALLGGIRTPHLSPPVARE